MQSAIYCPGVCSILTKGERLKNSLDSKQLCKNVYCHQFIRPLEFV